MERDTEIRREGRNMGGSRRQGNGSSQTDTVQRWTMMIGGSALAMYALARRKPAIAMAAAGGLIAYRGAKMPARSFRARASFAINCSPEEAYRMWRNFENLPLFMRHLQSVRTNGDGRSEWTAVGPMNTRVEWRAEITEERENEFIAWQSTQDSNFPNRGSVRFRRAPGNRGIIVTAEMEYEPPAGALGKAAAFMAGKHPEFTMREDLRRFKALMEAREIPTTEGQPHGPRSAKIQALHAMRPEHRKASEYYMGERMSAQRRAS
jgi:uncharacterized membrane protein